MTWQMLHEIQRDHSKEIIPLSRHGVPWLRRPHKAVSRVSRDKRIVATHSKPHDARIENSDVGGAKSRGASSKRKGVRKVNAPARAPACGHPRNNESMSIVRRPWEKQA